jgi:hypothetical protein
MSFFAEAAKRTQLHFTMTSLKSDEAVSYMAITFHDIKTVNFPVARLSAYRQQGQLYEENYQSIK